MSELNTTADIQRVLEEARSIAVLGAHVRPERAAHYVPEYLAEQGYRVIGVNPVYAGRELWGEPVVASLADLPTAVDMVNVFRPSHALPAHLPELLAMTPAPSVVWFQLGIRHEAVTARLVAAGMDVVQSRCTLADHRRFGLPART